MNSFPHDSVNHDRTYSSADFRNYFLPLVRNGVFADPADSCMVIAINNNRKVNIRAGRCYINGCIGYADGTETVEIPLPDDNYPRYDIIAARLDLVNRDIHIELIKGTPSGSPMYPELSRTSLKYDLGLAAIKSVPSSYDITQDVITDLRFDTNYCGVVTGIIDTINTTDLFAQYDARWDMLMAGFAGDETAIIAAFNALLTVKSVNGIAPADNNGNVALTIGDIPTGNGGYKPDKLIQCGKAETVSADSNATANVVFDTAYTSAPTISVCCEDVDGYMPMAAISNITENGFTVRTTNQTNHPMPTTVHWIAMGV